MVRRECGMRMGMGDESEARGKEGSGRAQSGIKLGDAKGMLVRRSARTRTTPR